MAIEHKPIDHWGDRRKHGLVVRGLHLDYPLFLALVILSLTGLAILYSASGQDLDIVNKQVIRLSIAFLVLFVFAKIPPHHIQRLAPFVYGAGILLLIAVLIIGQSGKGAQRWLDLGFMLIQPSEIMKIALPIMLSWYFSDCALPPSKKNLTVALIIIVIPFLLIMKQPDLGTSILIASSGVFVLLLSGVRWKYVLTFLIPLTASAPLLWLNLHDYQKSRVLTFLNPENDPLGAGYHIIQSKIALGSGGLYGKGWLNGTQSNLEFLPERTTDFIFAVFGEEFGFLGILLLFTLYGFIILRGLYIATQAQDTFARLLTGSLVLIFFVYTFVNIGMVTGILPVVGLPLPLISYGGSSMVTLMCAFGMIMSIQTHRKLLST